MAKYEKTERLEKVPMEYLWEGLVLSDNLYNYNGSVLLVPSGEVITKSKLDKLINFSDGNNYITTFRGSYEYIMKYSRKCWKTGPGIQNCAKASTMCFR